MSGSHPRVARRILNHQELAARHDRSREALVDAEPRRRHEVLSLVPVPAEHELLVFHEMERHRIGAEELARCLGDPSQQGLHRLNTGQLVADAKQCLETGLPRLQLFDEPRVGEGDARLAADAIHQPQFRRRAPMLLLEPGGEEPADRLALNDHRAEESGSVGEALQDLGVDARVGRHVARGHRMPLLPRLFHDAMPLQRDREGQEPDCQVGWDVISGDRPKTGVVGICQERPNHVCAHGLARFPGHAPHHLRHIQLR